MKIEGNQTVLKRIPTDLFSLDYALSSRSKLGIPVPGIIEIYGQTHVGKSTLAYHLASQLDPTGRVVLCDFEGIDIDYVQRVFEHGKFDGTLKIVDAVNDKGKVRSHEDMLNDLTDEFYNDEVSVGIVDSIGAITPIFEVESDIEEGFGAKRAIIVSRFVRRISIPIRGCEKPKTLFVINHSHAVMGGGYGHQSSGGVALQHAKTVSLYLRPKTADNIKTTDEVLAYVVEGQVEKLRYGGKGSKFQFVTIPGYGVRPHLSAVMDCVAFGKAERSTTVKIEDKSYGFISKMVSADLNDEVEAFRDFHQILEGLRNGQV